MKLTIIILAAGQGTRMRSGLPKVLHPLAGRPLLTHVLDVSEALEADEIHVVYGYGGDKVREVIGDRVSFWHEQTTQLGTGHAVAQALPAIRDGGQVLILYGDVPLLRQGTLSSLVALAGEDGVGLLTVIADNPHGYGRILRDEEGRVTGIVEHKDATATEQGIDEVNTGVLACPADDLHRWINALGNDNSQGEYYLTDIIEMAVNDGIAVRGMLASGEEETLGINDKFQLAEAEAIYRARSSAHLLREGVTLIDPTRVDVRGKLVTGRDVVIDVNTVFEGDVKLGDGVHVGANVVIRDSQIEDGTVIHANCVIERAHFGPRCQIGPFARVRPETYLGSEVKLGNFVEVKKSTVAKGSKINHLTYVGDSTIGAGVNVGAGTITCNYDGANKHQTRIGDDVFVGSGVQIVAPVSIGEGATIGAGTVLTKDAPPGQLTLARGKQRSIDGWQRPVKKPKD